jgi:predicted transposase/invertase (TIGR01784 family)
MVEAVIMGRLIRLDWAIKKILRDKANFSILEGFLSELLGFEITIREILESESNQESRSDKYNRVDMFAEDKDGRLYLIEVQNESEADYLQRLMYGTSKAMVQHIGAGQTYAKIRKIYSVSIVYFDLGQGEDYLYHGTTRFIGLRRKDDLSLTQTQKKMFKAETPADLFPEYYLIKVPKYDDQIRDTLDEWIYFLKNEEVRDDFKARGLQEAREKLNILKMNDNERAQYEAYLEDLRYQASMALSNYGVGHLEGLDEGRQKGLDEGIRQGKLATAQRMRAADFSNEKVLELTGLKKEDLNSLA